MQAQLTETDLIQSTLSWYAMLHYNHPPPIDTTWLPFFQISASSPHMRCNFFVQSISIGDEKEILSSAYKKMLTLWQFTINHQQHRSCGWELYIYFLAQEKYLYRWNIKEVSSRQHFFIIWPYIFLLSLRQFYSVQILSFFLSSPIVSQLQKLILLLFSLAGIVVKVVQNLSPA